MSVDACSRSVGRVIVICSLLFVSRNLVTVYQVVVFVSNVSGRFLNVSISSRSRHFNISVLSRSHLVLVTPKSRSRHFNVSVSSRSQHSNDSVSSRSRHHTSLHIPVIYCSRFRNSHMSNNTTNKTPTVAYM